MKNSCHNGTSMTACDNWIGSLVSAVESSPNWSSTAVFITFDDFGGFYDQVNPGTNSNPNLTQQGPRSPMLIVSPYAKAGYTDTTHTTFAGILAYTEHTLGVKSLGPNDNYAYDFGNAFDYTQVPLKSVKMQQRALPAGSVNLPAIDPDDPS
jgi:phospholipase C